MECSSYDKGLPIAFSRVSHLFAANPSINLFNQAGCVVLDCK
jgi:hypothetical protein